MAQSSSSQPTSPGSTGKKGAFRWLVMLLLAAILIGSLVIIFRSSNGAAPGRTPVRGAVEPVPYEYDAERNRYWHPGHGHWHDGRPPAQDQR